METFEHFSLSHENDEEIQSQGGSDPRRMVCLLEKQGLQPVVKFGKSQSAGMNPCVQQALSENNMKS